MTKEKHKNLVKKLKWLDRFVFDVMSDSSIKLDINNKPQDVLLCAQMAKMHTSYGAIIELIKQGYGIDAMVIVRSMLNNLINARWISKKYSKARSRRFVDYIAVLRKRALDVAKKYPEHKGVFNRILSEAGEINASYKKGGRKFKKREDKWSGKDLRIMSEEVDLIWDYDFIYKLASSLEHSDIHSFKDFVKNPNEQEKIIEFQAGPSDSYINESAITSVKYMGEGIKLVIKVFKLKESYEKRLNYFGKRFSNFIKG